MRFTSRGVRVSWKRLEREVESRTCVEVDWEVITLLTCSMTAVMSDGWLRMAL